MLNGFFYDVRYVKFSLKRVSLYQRKKATFFRYKKSVPKFYSLYEGFRYMGVRYTEERL